MTPRIPALWDSGREEALVGTWLLYQSDHRIWREKTFSWAGFFNQNLRFQHIYKSGVSEKIPLTIMRLNNCFTYQHFAKRINHQYLNLSKKSSASVGSYSQNINNLYFWSIIFYDKQSRLTKINYKWSIEFSIFYDK